jgi:predicted site-specific integrase-resolvase
MDNESYISPRKITKQFDITSATLRKWSEDGKIRCLRPNATGQRGGKRIYNLEDVRRIFGTGANIKPRKTICYARVSSTKQKEDLDRQIKFLKEAYKEAVIIKDIGSGLNWHRTGFKSILEQVYTGSVERVVVSYKDRLCRFGLELVEWIFKKANVKLVVLSKDTGEQDLAKELSEDLLAITTIFVAKNNGIRAAKYRKQRKEKEGREREGSIDSSEDKIISNESAETDA